MLFPPRRRLSTGEMRLPKMADLVLADSTECAMGCGGHAIAETGRWRMAALCVAA